MRPYITEPDHFRHEKPERLICERIDIEGYHNQRTVLSVPVVRLRPFKIYELVIRQPIPSDARGLPLYIKAIADMDFTPNISTGFGRKDECHREWDGEGRHEGFRHDGEHERGHMDPCEKVEVIVEKVEAKMFRVQMYGYANQAFGNDLVFRNEEPFPFIRFYLNDVNEMVMLPPCAPCEPRRHCEPRRVIRRKEIIVREPFMAETLGIGREVKEFVHPQRFHSFETFVEGSFGCGPHVAHRRDCW